MSRPPRVFELTAADITRFWAKVNKDGPTPIRHPELGRCWVWTASLNAYGYGQFYLPGGPVRAHRVAFQLLAGRATTLHVDHLCRNRACVRHVEEVTIAENNRRSWEGRGKSTRYLRGHEMIEPTSYYLAASGARNCKKCLRIRAKMRRERTTRCSR